MKLHRLGSAIISFRYPQGAISEE